MAARDTCVTIMTKLLDDGRVVSAGGSLPPDLAEQYFPEVGDVVDGMDAGSFPCRHLSYVLSLLRLPLSSPYRTATSGIMGCIVFPSAVPLTFSVLVTVVRFACPLRAA